MERFLLSVRQLCILVLLLIAGSLAALAGILNGSSWNLLFGPVTGPGIFYIDSVEAVAEWPIKQETIKHLLHDEAISVPTFPIKIGITGTSAAQLIPSFGDQFSNGMRHLGIPISGDLTSIKYAFYIDIDSKILATVPNAYLFYYSIWSPHEVYIDGKLTKSALAREALLPGGQIISKGESKSRIVIVVENDQPNAILGLNFRDGLSIRTGQEASRATILSVLQSDFPRIVNATVFTLLGLFALGLGASAFQFLDIWAYACFCISMGLQAWSYSPIFYLGFSNHWDRYSAVQASCSGAVVVSSVILTLSFFRFEKQRRSLDSLFQFLFRFDWMQRIDAIKNLIIDPLRGVTTATLILSIIAVARFWAPSTSIPAWQATISTHTMLGYILAAGQIVALALGTRHLAQVRRRFKNDGLSAQVRNMRIRATLSVVYIVCMGIMLSSFAVNMGSLSVDIGSENILLAALFPALAMLLMFQWMTTSAQRFHKRFAPRLGQIDHEVMAFGDRVFEKRYQGTLLVFDLAGMKRLNELRDLSPSVENVVDGLISRVENDISQLIETGNITFRYKSNGDEFIFAMRAQNLEAAKKQMIELIGRWQRVAVVALQTWRTYLVDEFRRLNGLDMHIERVYEIAAALDLHVLVTTMHAMKITIKGGVDRPTAAPDFVEARFTALSALFKPTTHIKIAMYRDDAELVMAALRDQDGIDIRFDEEKAATADRPAMGFITWNANIKSRSISAA